MEGSGGDAGIPTLYSCPDCGSSYFDLAIKFEGSWKEPAKKKAGGEKSESWLAASARVDADAARRLRDQRFGGECHGDSSL